MKKLISIFAMFCFAFSFSQKSNSIEDKLNKLWNNDINNKAYDSGVDNKTKKTVIKFYSCMIKNYKFKPKDFIEFMTNKQIENLKKEQNVNENNEYDFYKNNSFYLSSYTKLNYIERIENQKAFPKCIKKSDIDW